MDNSYKQGNKKFNVKQKEFISSVNDSFAPTPGPSVLDKIKAAVSGVKSSVSAPETSNNNDFLKKEENKEQEFSDKQKEFLKSIRKSITKE